MAFTDFCWSDFNKHSGSCLYGLIHLLHQIGPLEEESVIETMGRANVCKYTWASLIELLMWRGKWVSSAIGNSLFSLCWYFCFWHLPFYKMIIRSTSKHNLTFAFILTMSRWNQFSSASWLWCFALDNVDRGQNFPGTGFLECCFGSIPS